MRIFLFSVSKCRCTDQPCIANHIYRADVLKGDPVGKQSVGNMTSRFMHFKEMLQQVVRNVDEFGRILLVVVGKMNIAFKCVPANENNHFELIDSSRRHVACFDQFTTSIHLFIYLLS